jgi:hypothetical protein
MTTSPTWSPARTSRTRSSRTRPIELSRRFLTEGTGFARAGGISLAAFRFLVVSASLPRSGFHTCTVDGVLW